VQLLSNAAQEEKNLIYIYKLRKHRESEMLLQGMNMYLYESFPVSYQLELYGATPKKSSHEEGKTGQLQNWE